MEAETFLDITKILGEMKNQFNDTKVTTEEVVTVTNGIEGDSDVPDEVVKLESENGTKTDSDETPLVMCFRKPQKLKRTVKPKKEIKEIVEVGATRRSRRKSRDYSESVLKSAIARKEKSYNESNKPQRLTRQLKPTQKILENLATAALQHKKPEKGGERKNSRKKTKGEAGKKSKRSHRLTSQEMKSKKLIGNDVCECTIKTRLYFLPETDEETYCMAIDGVNETLIGCGNRPDYAHTSMVRPSNRVPYVTLCTVHLNRMTRHNCCPGCGLFCTEGTFSQCRNKHQYHRECRGTGKSNEFCLHCGEATLPNDFSIKVDTECPLVFKTSRLA